MTIQQSSIVSFLPEYVRANQAVKEISAILNFTPDVDALDAKNGHKYVGIYIKI